MKKIYASVFMMMGMAMAARAAEGDTTIVQAHQGTQLSWYDNYDVPVSFPDGSLSYQKIVMDFTLGKYNCGNGYDPSNPGETNQGGTGWCADWDYDVHIRLITQAGDTLEMGELITPYANSTFPGFPWAWTHHYYYDVTDFYPLLRDNAIVRVFYSGYSGGFTADVKFHFIEGTPPRNVVAIKNLWHGGFAYGNASDPIESKVAARTETFPANAVSAETKVIISGHGGDNTENCSEFCRKWYQYKINGTSIAQQDIWRDNCGDNPLYVQSGTWPIDRANWCPGAAVREHIHKVPASVMPGQDFTVDMDFQSYTSGNNGASYKLSAIMFYYGAFNHALDAGIDEILSPTSGADYKKLNPICGAPELMVRNYGGSTITSVTFEYGIEGSTLSSYTWNTSLASMEAGKVTLPELAAIRETSGNANRFVVRITQVNGSTDENPVNDKASSVFSAAPVWNGGRFVLSMKTSSAAPFGAGTNTVTYRVYDMTQDMALVKERTGTGAGTITTDTLRLDNGCYKLVVETPKGYGLSFFNYIGTRGYVRMTDLYSGTRYAMEDTDLGASGLEGNFGNGFVHYFRVQDAGLGISNADKSAYSLNVYPNPAKDRIHIDVYGQIGGEAEVRLVNLLGQTVYRQSTRSQNITIRTEGLANGIYTLIYNTGNSRRTEKVVIAQ